MAIIERKNQMAKPEEVINVSTVYRGCSIRVSIARTSKGIPSTDLSVTIHEDNISDVPDVIAEVKRQAIQLDKELQEIYSKERK